MKSIDLNGVWQFKAVDAYRRLPSDKRMLKRWLNALVPGTVHLDLLRNRIIPDPFYRMNENDVQWVDAVCWLYRKEMIIPEEFLSERKVNLIAKGLDTYATITWNGRRAGECANMFIEHRFDVKQFLRRGKNIVEILFDSPTVRSKALEKQYGTLGVALEPHRVYIRKDQYAFGWDWGPKLATSGIWKDIRLEAYSHSRLRDPCVKVMSVSKREATVVLSAEIERLDRSDLTFLGQVDGHGISVSVKKKVKGDKISVALRVPHPNVWWPNGYGEQPLYNAIFILRMNNAEIHSTVVPFGIRVIRLLQEADSAGISFIFEINGKKIFCKGANWIPADSFLPRIPQATYESLLQMAKGAHMNMIRVWGGGIYEQDVFYRLCDKLGLMVWQDFMFACAEYPETKSFVKNVQAEAEQVVRRLRNHPSVVIWCGNNECEWLYCKENPEKTPDDMQGAKIFREILPIVCRKNDGTRPYWRSSPFGKGYLNDESNGNHHQWLVWSGWQDFKAYGKDMARFITEFGFQAVPDRQTIGKVTLSADRFPQSEVMEHHNKQLEGIERLVQFQSAHYRLGSDFGDFIYKSQLTQAEALKFGVEHWRRRKFKTAGTLFWQLNDCWPVSSWSVIDYGLRPKAGYYFAKKFFAPFLVSFKNTSETTDVWITNDIFEEVSFDLTVAFRSFDGKIYWVKNLKIRIPSNSSKRVHGVNRNRCSAYDLRRAYIHARLKLDGHVVSENRFFFKEPKHLLLTSPRIETRLEKISNHVILLTAQSAGFAKSVRVEFTGADVKLDDNYFELDPGEPRTITLLTSCSVNELRKRINLKWL